MLVLFLYPYGIYNAGERADLPDAITTVLVTRGLAEACTPVLSAAPAPVPPAAAMPEPEYVPAPVPVHAPVHEPVPDPHRSHKRR
jgi:hypothetical protein